MKYFTGRTCSGGRWVEREGTKERERNGALLFSLSFHVSASVSEAKIISSFYNFSVSSRFYSCYIYILFIYSTTMFFVSREIIFCQLIIVKFTRINCQRMQYNFKIF